MSAHHTKGRIKVQHPHAGPRGFELADEKTGLIQVCQDVTEPNARRLAACWNACEGLQTDLLENITPMGDTLASRFKARDETEREVAAQRDELLEALRIAREHIQIDRNSFKEAHSFPDGFMEREDQATLKRLDQKLSVIDAAIAKAEAP